MGREKTKNIQCAIGQSMAWDRFLKLQWSCAIVLNINKNRIYPPGIVMYVYVGTSMFKMGKQYL